MPQNILHRGWRIPFGYCHENQVLVIVNGHNLGVLRN